MGNAPIQGSWKSNETSDISPCAGCGVTTDSCDWANHINPKHPEKKVYYFYHLAASEESYSIGKYLLFINSQLLVSKLEIQNTY